MAEASPPASESKEIGAAEVETHEQEHDSESEDDKDGSKSNENTMVSFN